MSGEEVELEKNTDLANGVDKKGNGEQNGHKVENGDLPPVEGKTFLICFECYDSG